MFKKLIICLLTLMLVLCGSAALAADTLSEELARVTQAVKTTLDIGDEYTDFFGEQQERGYGVSWYLNWNSAEGNLTVEVDSDGQITSYHCYEYNSRYYSSDYAPIYPHDQNAEAQKAAEAFANRLLAKGETVSFQENEAPLPRLYEQDSYYFSGHISVNGLLTPLYISMSVSAADMSVTSFWRDTLNTNYIGGIPSATPKVTAATARQKLAPLQKLELAYFRDNFAATEARLQYRPLFDNTYLVDAQSGAVLDMNKLNKEAQDKIMDRGIATGGSGAARDGDLAFAIAADEAAPAPKMAELSAVEQQGIEKLEGALTRDQLDAKIRAISEFGLDKSYILSQVSYGKEQRDSEIFPTANLNYYREADARSLGITEQALKKLKDEGRQLYIYKYFAVDALSGDLRHFSTDKPYINELLITGKKQANLETTAQAFLSKYFGKKFADITSDSDGSDQEDNGSFRYVQQVNGYRYADNWMGIWVNPFTGVIEYFNAPEWRDDIVFASAEGIISEQQALDIYVETLACELEYRGLPEAIDPANPEMKPLVISSYGGSRLVYRLALTYGLEADYPNNIYAIDALTGEKQTYEQRVKNSISYDDIEGHANQAQIEKLAQHGVGFAGGSFKPASQLTELDMICFLLSADGWQLDPQDMTKEKTDEMYRQAYVLGILERGQRQPDKLINRGEFVKTLVSMSGYGKTAALPGIYVCNFADAAQIPAELYGYVAIAQGLGLVSGGGDKSFKAAETINRAEAAVIFHNFLSRKY